ncbi:MAG: Crp/Fnr family transcriptional regulator [Beijerinckiaceae bacterium]|jgi:CRP-like cAMP-binding protein|nr:Crp/Fnr family transcriptional regulator [Beijerinckiaceae bacterium]
MGLEHRNRLLRAVEADILAQFSARLLPVELRKGAPILNLGDPVDWVYFPDGALIAIMSETPAGESVASALVGFDGALGVFEACGSRTSFQRAVVHVAGRVWRMRASAYRELYDASPNLRTAVHKHIELILAESRQFVACNAIHPVEGRLSRSLLDGLDKSDPDTTLPLTQEALAQMLGVQRTTVAVCVSALQKQGLLRNGRGAIEVLDRSGLEKAACACRKALQFIRQEIYSSHSESCDA